MKLATIGALSLITIGASSWLLLNREPVSKPHRPEVTALKPAGTTATAEWVKESSTPGVETNEVIELRQLVDELTVALKGLVAERSSAEALMQHAERDIASLERFIEEIEERGEDPVDYADEGLAMFQPASDAYQDASEKLELAKTMEQAATAELNDAATELANILVKSDTEQ